MKEAVERGFDVAAIARSANKTVAEKFIEKDIFDLAAADLAEFDAVVDAFGIFEESKLEQHSATLAHLCDAVANNNTRLLVVGGAGSLYVDSEHTTQLFDTPDFPSIFKPLAKAQGKQLDELRKRNDVKWTYISPAGDFQADGERAGSFTLAGEELILDERGESIISYTDYAIAMVDEIDSGDHIQQRISIVRK